MAAAKASADPCLDIAGSTMVATMARNGTDFGIRVAGLGERWFTAPVSTPEASTFWFTAADANPDMGDSAIVRRWGSALRHGRLAPRWSASSARAGCVDAVRGHGGDGRDHARGASPLPHPHAGRARHARGNPMSESRGDGHRAPHQYGHRRPGAAGRGRSAPAWPAWLQLACFEQALDAIARERYRMREPLDLLPRDCALPDGTRRGPRLLATALSVVLRPRRPSDPGV